MEYPYKVTQKKDALFDLLTAGNIDTEDFKRQSQRLQEEQRHCQERLAQQQQTLTTAWKISADRVLELAKNVESLWKSASKDKKIEIIKIISSNQRLNGLTVEYDFRKPFGTIGEIAKKEEWSARLDLNQRPLAPQASALPS